jgi:hypothetical protein
MSMMNQLNGLDTLEAVSTELLKEVLAKVEERYLQFRGVDRSQENALGSRIELELMKRGE